MTIEYVTADAVDFNQFSAALNSAYSDYYIPLNMSPDELRARVLQDDIQLHLSCAARDGEQIVGVALLAKRGDNAWIGGVGVIPSHRGQGIGRQVMNFLLDKAREVSIHRVQLEVITLNDKARKLYDSLGFVELRLLHVAEGLPNITTVPANHTYAAVPVEAALEHQELFHQTPLPWQRADKAIRSLAVQLQAHAAYQEETLVAYAIGVFRPGVVRFVDIAHAPDNRDASKALRGLVTYIHGRYPGVQGGIINIAENDPAWGILFLLGYKPYLSQHEMALTLGVDGES